MKASSYWSLLNGYWTLFKGRDTFTALWDAMIKSCEEFSRLYSHVSTGGIITAEENVALVWEQIIIGGDGAVRVAGKAYDIASISSIRSDVGRTQYVDGVDYTFDSVTKKITWRNAPSSSTGEFLAEEIYINTGIIDSFYNSGLYNLDLSLYSSPSAKWVLYACVKHFGFMQTPSRMKNIMSILAGAPFSKYYGEFSVSGAYCNINYAVDVSNDHELFLQRNELDGYCYLDEQTGEIYDGIYPPNNTTLVLCHKNNIVKNGEKYSIVLRGEQYPYTGISTPYTSGELAPISLLVGAEEGTAGHQYSGVSIPLYDVVALDGNATSAKCASELAGLIQPIMMLKYTDNITIASTEISVTGSNEIRVNDPNVYLFMTYEDIIITDVTSGVSRYCNIKSGYYNESDETYIFGLTIDLVASHPHTICIPIIRSSMCPVTHIGSGELVIYQSITSDQLPVLMQCPAGISEGRTLYVKSGTVGTGLMEFDTSSNPNVVAVGDTIAITSDGDQDYYTVIDISDFPEISVTPKLRRSYASGCLAYNLSRSLDIGRIHISGDGIGHGHINNIKAYIKEWIPCMETYCGIEPTHCDPPTVSDVVYVDDTAVITIIPHTETDIVYYSVDGDAPVIETELPYGDKNLDNPILRDQRYWQRMDQEAIKEIKE